MTTRPTPAPDPDPPPYPHILGGIPGVEVTPNRRCGVPVLRGTRISVAQVIAELADCDYTLAELADAFGFSQELAAGVLHHLAARLGRKAPELWTEEKRVPPPGRASS